MHSAALAKHRWPIAVDDHGAPLGNGFPSAAISEALRDAKKQNAASVE